MTVSSTTSKVSYTATSSQTVFAYTFKIFANADLKVYVNSVLKTLTTDYTVSGAGVTSGGNVTFGTGLTASDIVVIERVITLTQGTDYVENDPFPADTHEEALDRLTFIGHQHQDTLDRSIKFATTVTDAGDVEIAATAAIRANKLFAFDASGDLDVTQEIGVFKGNWAASTAYVVRDLIKDTSNNNIYICITAHTSTGAQPISSNTDVAKWTLIVDAATAASSSTAAAASATAAATSATNAATSETNAASSATTATNKAAAASTSETNAASSASSASTSASSASTDLASFQGQYKSGATDPYSSKDAGDLWYDTANSVLKVWTGSAWNAPVTDAETAETNAGTSATNAAASATSASGSASTATTQASNASTSASNAATSETNAASSASSASTAKTAAEAAQAAAELAADNFDDTYLGAKASDPTVDNDGDALTSGDMYFNTGTDRMRVYSGSAWADVAIDSATVVSKTSATGSGVLPASTTANRDGSPSAGYIRFNTTDTSFEGYDGSAWGAIGGGATGGGADTVFWNNGQTVTTSYSVPANTNSMSAGPTITINSSVVITIPSSSHWTIV